MRVLTKQMTKPHQKINKFTPEIARSEDFREKEDIVPNPTSNEESTRV